MPTILPPLSIQEISNNDTSRRLVQIYNLMAGRSPEFCVSRGAGIGDLLMSTPIAKFLCEQFPDSRVTYATDLDYLGGALPNVLKYNPYVSRVVDWDKISKADYDAVISLGGMKASFCPARMHETPGARPLNRIDLFAQSAGISLTDKRLLFYVQDDEKLRIGKILSDRFQRPVKGLKFVVVNPCASNPHRSPDQLMLREAVKLIRSMNPDIKIIILKHSSDFDRDVPWSDIADLMLKDWEVRDIAALLTFTHLLICPDSALLHVAGALDTLTLALFGSTDPAARVNYYPNVAGYCPGVKLQCWPGWYDCGGCRHRSCWKLILPKNIAEMATRMIKEGTNFFTGSKRSESGKIKTIQSETL